MSIYEVNGKRRASYVGPFLPLYPEIPPPMWDRVSFGDAEFHYAARLLDRPDDEVGKVLAAHWKELEDPTTLTSTILDDLNVTPHTSVEQQVAELPADVKPEPHRQMWNPYAYYVQTIPCF